MSTQKNLITLCLAAVLTLGLAACGGGSGSDQAAAPDPTPPPPTTTDPLPTADGQLTMAQDAVTAAETAVAAATTPAQISAAYAALAAAQAQLATAESIPENQIALLRDRIIQIQMDLDDATMLAGQRDSVGTALTAAQTAVGGLTKSSSDADANAAGDLVAAVEAALANASALPADDALHTSVMAVATQLAGVEMSRTVYSQQGAVDAALIGAQAAVDALSNASTDAEVEEARDAVMAAQAELALATDLSADDPRHASVMGAHDSLGDAVTMRTAHMETQAIQDLITEAQTAVGGLDQVTSSETAVADARAAVMAVTDTIAAATALTEEEMATLAGMVSAADTSLGAIEDYRDTPAGQLEVAESALERADVLVKALMPTSTAEDAAAAYGALGQAQAAIHAARALPANVITRLQGELDTANDDLGDANRLAGERETVGIAIATATTAIGDLTVDSTDEDVAAARAAVADAQTALDDSMEMGAEEKAGLGQQIAGLGTQIGNVETLQMAAETERMQTEQRNAALSVLSMAQAKINGLTDDSPAADVEAARGLVTDAQNALDAATGLSQSEREGLQMLVAAADSSVDGYETIVAARPTQEEIEAEEARVVATTKEAGTKDKAIEAEAADDAGLGGEANETAEAERDYHLDIKRPRSGTEIKITDDGLAGDDDPKFAEVMDLGGGRTMHVRTMEADADNDNDVVQEIVIVATDIDAPKARVFTKVYDLDVTKETGLAATGTDENDSLDIPDNDDPNPTELESFGRVMATPFAASTAAELTFLPVDKDDEETPANEARDAYETSGTYDGAMGRYTCTGTGDCTVVLDAEGMITGMTGGWVFTPNPRVTVDVADADYLHYGFWLKKTTDEDGVLTYNEVQTFAGSSIDRSGSVAAVTGSATYEGGATGVYVHAVTNPDGTRASATSGHFSADAELTAYFIQTVNDPDTAFDEAGRIAPALLETLSGTIDNFDLSGQDTGPGWSVTLQGEITMNDGTAAGTAMGGSGMGSFNATFHGPAEHDHDDDALTIMVPIAPGSVVGEFNAGFSNGSVAGGFGARKE